MNFAYSDITDILARKAEGRRSLQKLSMAEKIMRIEALRERLSPFKVTRLKAEHKNRSMAEEGIVVPGPMT